MYCIGCGAENHDGSAHCIRCGQDLGTLRTDEYKEPSIPQSTVFLWNPDVAALLSIPFSPIFGAIVHAQNWRRLGQRSRAARSWLWAAAILVTTIVFSIYAETTRLSRSAMNGGYNLIQFATLVLWYFGAARGQGKYVAREMRGEYQKESWIIPVCLAIIVIGSMWGLAGSLR